MKRNMINQGILNKIRNGTCAIGYLSVPLEKYEQNISSPYFHIIGTGFLVCETKVITNRHVIEYLLEEQAGFGFPDSQFFLMFVTPGKRKDLPVIIRMIQSYWMHEDPLINVGFLDFKIVDKSHFKDIAPLEIVISIDLNVTEEIAVYGYPFGNDMLKRNEQVYRWGPVIQRGFISSIAPFDTTSEPEEILLDIRTAGGMSGAPIFRPSTGKVIGIHHAGWDATTALGLPLTHKRILEWLSIYDKKRN